MKHIQPKTLQIMVAILATVTFSQRMLWRLCNNKNTISIGQVNKVVNDLHKKGFVEELFKRKRLLKIEEKSPIKDLIKNFDHKNARYRLSDPLGLLRYISLFRSIKDLQAFNMHVDAKEEEVIKELSKKKAIFCLGTAQQRFTPYFRPDEVSFYSTKPEEIYGFLKSAKRGNTKISCYRIDYMRELDDINSLVDHLFAQKEKRTMFTTKVQTVIDMFCDGKGVYTKPLLKNLWGVEI
jgi:hypothetical protein